MSMLQYGKGELSVRQGYGVHTHAVYVHMLTLLYTQKHAASDVMSAHAKENMHAGAD